MHTTIKYYFVFEFDHLYFIILLVWMASSSHAACFRGLMTYLKYFRKILIWNWGKSQILLDTRKNWRKSQLLSWWNCYTREIEKISNIFRKYSNLRKSSNLRVSSFIKVVCENCVIDRSEIRMASKNFDWLRLFHLLPQPITRIW